MLVIDIISGVSRVAIIQFPNTISLPQTLPCIVCSLTVVPAKATVGMLDAHNQQVFACNAHFWDKHCLLIDGWIAFATQERMKLLARKREEATHTYGWGDGNARAVY